MTDPTPFIPAGQEPSDVGTMQLRMLAFNLTMTDEEIDTVAAQAKTIRNTYTAWQSFADDLAARKKRLLGFMAVVAAMDVQAAATAMKTTPELVAGVMNANATAEQARIVELQALWDAGQLPDRPVLTDPSRQVIDDTNITP